MLLADSAQVAEQKLYVMGGGWSFIGPEVGPFALAVLAQIDWSESDFPHNFRLELQDEDARPVLLGDPPQPVAVEGVIEVGRPPGHPVGTSLNVPLAINFGPLPIPPGHRYVWALTVDSSPDRVWRAAFNVRSATDNT